MKISWKYDFESLLPNIGCACMTLMLLSITAIFIAAAIKIVMWLFC